MLQQRGGAVGQGPGAAAIPPTFIEMKDQESPITEGGVVMEQGAQHSRWVMSRFCCHREQRGVCQGHGRESVEPRCRAEGGEAARRARGCVHTSDSKWPLGWRRTEARPCFTSSFSRGIVVWSLVRVGSRHQGIHQDQLSLNLMSTRKRKVRRQP